MITEVNTLPNITTFNFAELNQFAKIYVLVSGGIDSTYLYEMVKQECDPAKVCPVNCYNPYEQSATLTQISCDPNYVQVKPLERMDYARILENAFRRIPHVRQMKRQGKYQKKLFQCCTIIKHKTFLKIDLFKEEGTVVISGIKAGDGQQRHAWLLSLQRGIPYSKGTTPVQGFYHRHKGGQLYCYPFRDFTRKELPKQIIEQLRARYPTLRHSGCSLCPVLVVFNIKSEGERYWRSLRYYHSLVGQGRLF
jgi:3'-phosphoadenosine 5'-phosphosulfate sulfotransferase (PAPS reductase)/FAD synthetase